METRGVVLLISILQGKLKKGDVLKSYYSDKKYDIFEIGIVQPVLNSIGFLNLGQVGYILTNLKDIKDAKIGNLLIIS